MLTKSNGRRSLDRCKQLCEAVIYSCLAYSFNLWEFTNGGFSTTEPYVLSEKASKQKKKKKRWTFVFVGSFLRQRYTRHTQSSVVQLLWREVTYSQRDLVSAIL